MADSNRRQGKSHVGEIAAKIVIVIAELFWLSF